MPWQPFVRVVPRVIGPRLGLHWGLHVLAVILLAAMVPAYRRHGRRVKTVEAMNNLQRIYDAEVAYFNRSSEESVAQFVSASATPASAPTATRYPANPSAWTRDPGWRALGFSIRGPHYFQYRVEATNPRPVSNNHYGPGPDYHHETGENFTITAIGDLDGDGVFSTFSRSGVLWRLEINGSLPAIINELE